MVSNCKRRTLVCTRRGLQIRKQNKNLKSKNSFNILYYIMLIHFVDLNCYHMLQRQVSKQKNPILPYITLQVLFFFFLNRSNQSKQHFSFIMNRMEEISNIDIPVPQQPGKSGVFKNSNSAYPPTEQGTKTVLTL